MAEQLPSAQFEKIIELYDPVLHIHRFTVEGLEFGKFDVGVDNAVEGVELWRPR